MSCNNRCSFKEKIRMTTKNGRIADQIIEIFDYVHRGFTFHLRHSKTLSKSGKKQK